MSKHTNASESDGSIGGAETPPQLIKSAPTLLVGYEADPDALRRVLPPELEPHPNNLVQMNMYRVPDDRRTSQLDEYTLTYLTVEVADRDSSATTASGHEFDIPGRYWTGYWTDAPGMEAFAREQYGLSPREGSCSWERDGDDLVSTLSVDGRDVIEARATVGDEQVGTMTGQLNYFSSRETAAQPVSDGGSGLVGYPIPFVSDLQPAEVDAVEFDFDDASPASALAPAEPLRTPSVMHGRVTFTLPRGVPLPQS